MSIVVRLFKEIMYGGLERFGKFYSTYRGFVYDNNDPKSLNRLRLVIPHVTLNDYHDYWALPKSNFSGKGFGIQMIPIKGELVWVEFENGNPEHPIWSHGYFGNGDKPTFDDRFKDIHSYWLCSPHGNFAIINDTKNEISIKTKDGNYIQVNESGVSIVLNGNKEISLGSLNHSGHWGTFGELTEEILNLLNDWNNKLETALQLDIALAVKSGSPKLGYINLQKALPGLKTKIIEIKGKIPKIVSNKVSLD